MAWQSGIVNQRFQKRKERPPFMKNIGICQFIWERCSSKLTSNSLSISKTLISRKGLYEISPYDKEPWGAFPRPFSTFPSRIYYSKIRYIMPPINRNSIKLQLTKIVFLLCLILVKRTFTRKKAERKDFFFQKIYFQGVSWGKKDTDQSSLFFIFTTITWYLNSGDSKWCPRRQCKMLTHHRKIQLYFLDSIY